MKKISIGNAPAYTSPNSMTLICTEKPDGSTNPGIELTGACLDAAPSSDVIRISQLRLC